MTGAFPDTGMGKCEMCGSDGLLYDGGSVLYCDTCQRGFLASTEQYMVEDNGHIFYLLADGSVTDGDLKYASVADLKRVHVVIYHRVAIQ